MDWVREVLLPDLLKKQETAGSSHITVSERQADCLSRVMSIVSFGIGSGRRTHMECIWDTRTVKLYRENGRYSLWIGKTESELKAIADAQHMKEIERQKEHLARMKSWKPEKYEAEIQQILSEIADYESYDDRDDWENRHLEELRYIIA